MKRRYFLQAGTAGFVAVAIGDFFSERDSGMATPQKVFEVTKTERQWKAILTPQQFRVLREKGTEPPETSPLDREYRPGTYRCAGCSLPLFSSQAKFDSGTGWPSFYAPIERAIDRSIDRSFWMVRVEVHCRRCGGHLGHVFDDGPRPTGKRYCINGVALEFLPAHGNGSSEGPREK